MFLTHLHGTGSKQYMWKVISDSDYLTGSVKKSNFLFVYSCIKTVCVLWQAGGSTGLLMDLAANEKAVHSDFFNGKILISTRLNMPLA